MTRTCPSGAPIYSSGLRNPTSSDRKGRPWSRRTGRLLILLVASLGAEVTGCDSKSSGPPPPTGGTTGTASGGRTGLGGAGAGGATLTGNAGGGGQATGGAAGGGVDAGGGGTAGGGAPDPACGVPTPVTSPPYPTEIRF